MQPGRSCNRVRPVIAARSARLERPMTNRTTSCEITRGYVQRLEQQNQDMQNRIHDLKQQLIEGGLNVKPWKSYQNSPAPSYDYNPPCSASQTAVWSTSMLSSTSQLADLPQSKSSYSKTIEDIKVEKRQSTSQTNRMSPPLSSQNLTYKDTTEANGDNKSSAYILDQSQLTYQQIPHPAATQYCTYPNPTTKLSNLGYTAHDNSSSPPSPGPARAPYLEGFVPKVSQVAPVRCSTPISTSISSASRDWHQWTITMAANAKPLEPQNCYSADAEMQFSGQLMDGSVDNSDASANMADLGVGAEREHSHPGHSVHHRIGTKWPLNILGMG